ncbi:MAG: transglutaminase domain-containing protein [Pseudonocardiales bacterium]|nr:transglutaminase domain-containing protein [Pseudonocardiales bacterium]
MTTKDHLPPDLAPTDFLDYRSAEVQDFVQRWAPATVGTDTERAISLYYAVRERVRYEVYGADLSRSGLRASRVLRAGSGLCIHKSVLYAAALRAIGVPSRLVFADVRNHLASERLRALVGGDVFRYHCLTSVSLGGRWVKATPVFPAMLCKLYHIAPLEFDGITDSLHHPFDLHGRRHMEFLYTHGEFADLPYDLVINGLRRAHPRVFGDTDGSLLTDARTTPARP